MDENIPQNIKRIGDDDWYAEISEGYNEDSSKDEYNSHRYGGNNPRDKYQ